MSGAASPADGGAPARVRDGRCDDAAAIAALLHQLGYGRTESQVRAFVAGDHGCAVLVAEAADAVVGLAVVSLRPQLHLGGWIAAIDAMVVDAPHRGRGIGSRLLRAVEARARAHDAVLVEVHSNDARHGAHRFYRRHGLADTSRYFVKRLG